MNTMSLNDEFEREDLDDEQTIAYIRNYLPSEMKERFTDDDMYYLLDVLSDYYCDHNVFDAEPDEEGFIDIDLDAVVDYVKKESDKDGMGPWTVEELFFFVQGEMEYTDTLADDEE